jgi:hypothetical protein
MAEISSLVQLLRGCVAATASATSFFPSRPDFCCCGGGGGAAPKLTGESTAVLLARLAIRTTAGACLSEGVKDWANRPALRVVVDTLIVVVLVVCVSAVVAKVE